MQRKNTLWSVAEVETLPSVVAEDHIQKELDGATSLCRVDKYVTDDDPPTLKRYYTLRPNPISLFYPYPYPLPLPLSFKRPSEQSDKA